MKERVEERLQQVRSLGEVICIRLKSEVDKLGLEEGVIDPLLEQADYELSRDPASGEDTLMGVWRDARGNKLGEILFHGDGSFFAEYDVIRNHPKDKRWFVEAVTAWGRGSNVRSEPRLIPTAT
jgi:hypothetical protein